MKIGIDARFAVRQRRGIGNYTLKLIHSLSVIDGKNEYILYIDREDKSNVLPRRNNFTIKKICPGNYPVWEQIMLPLQAKRDGVEILHCTGNTAPLFLDRKIKLVMTIHDVMYLKDYSEVPRSASLYQRLGRLYRKIIVPRAVRRRPMLLTVSEFSKNDILKHLPELDKKRIKSIHEAAGENYRLIDKELASRNVRTKLNVEDPYILVLGALDPRKNTESVIRYYIELRSGNKIKEKLLIVGIPNWEQTKFYQMAQASDFNADIVFTKFISENDLVSLYNGARIFIYPSSYEGFGIPLLEAMACGVPVITSNVTSIPEVTGDAAILINPTSGDELKAAVVRLTSNADLRKDLISRGLEQVTKFSWAKTAGETLLAYESVYKMDYKKFV
jgi:glycosyltransferase involved in cell wall biosynthesis